MSNVINLLNFIGLYVILDAAVEKLMEAGL